MAVSLREYRARIRSIESTKKITRAMELIASARIIRAQHALAAARPYARELNRAVSEAATWTESDHPLLTGTTTDSNRGAVLAITSDRGLAGAYSANVQRQTDRLIAKLRAERRDVALYVAGRKGAAHFSFRNRDIASAWFGHSDRPNYDLAAEIGNTLIEQFLTENTGVDDVYVVYTRFHSRLTQQVVVTRLLPPEVVDSIEVPDKDELLPLYDFEPSAAAVLDSLLPRYMHARIYYFLLHAAVSELAARQRAMKAATDNATELINAYTRVANQARQALITEEISEIVGGANALADLQTRDD